MKKESGKWTVYLLRCADNTLYCGVTNDIEKRLLAHNDGNGARYTRSRLPVKIVATRANLTKREAYRIEYRIKRLPACKKIKGMATCMPIKDK